MQRVGVRVQGCMHLSVACMYVGQDVMFFGGHKAAFQKTNKQKKKKAPLNTHSKRAYRYGAGGGGGGRGVFERLSRRKKTLYQFPSR